MTSERAGGCRCSSASSMAYMRATGFLPDIDDCPDDGHDARTHDGCRFVTEVTPEVTRPVHASTIIRMGPAHSEPRPSERRPSCSELTGAVQQSSLRVTRSLSPCRMTLSRGPLSGDVTPSAIPYTRDDSSV